MEEKEREKERRQEERTWKGGKTGEIGKSRERKGSIVYLYRQHLANSKVDS